MTNGLEPATLKHVDWLASRLRPEHVREAEGLAIGAAAEQLAESFALSVACLCGIRRGRPIYVMGILSPAEIGRHSRVWMLGTSEIDLYPRWLLRTVRDGIRFGFEHSGAESIGAWLPEWYEVGLNFLERLAFHETERAFRGTRGGLHIFMSRRRDG